MSTLFEKKPLPQIEIILGKTEKIIAIANKNMYNLGEGLIWEMVGVIPILTQDFKIHASRDKKMKKKEVRVMQDLLGSNQKIADTIRKELSERGILTINLLSSPGAGKTSLLECLAGKLTPKFKMAVIEGDIETERDADRIRAKGIPAWQIMTGGACHLEAKMIGKLFSEIPADLDFLFIENVGNLVCPAGFDLGENIRFVLLSTPEGDDKPKKYPKVFVTSQCLIISKVDLVPLLPFDIANAKKEAKEINPKLKIFTTSAQTGTGIDELVDYLSDSLKALRKKHA